jgi:hypothetical protein
MTNITTPEEMHKAIKKTSDQQDRFKEFPNINKAFKKIRELGIIAKQRWYCCSSCGHGAMSEEFNGAYLFYHEQDYEILKETGVVYLAHGSNDEDTCLHCMFQDVMKILKDCGLKPAWNYQNDTRIKITEPHIKPRMNSDGEAIN